MRARDRTDHCTFQNAAWGPVHEKTKDLLDQDIVGKVHHVRSRFSPPGPGGWSPRSTWFTDAEASGGGALIDIGIHNADLTNHLFGDVTELMGYSDTLSMDTEVEDTAVAVLRFEDGTLGTFETAWRTTPNRSRCRSSARRASSTGGASRVPRGLTPRLSRSVFVELVTKSISSYFQATIVPHIDARVIRRPVSIENYIIFQGIQLCQCSR
ncbi:Gfo/Idh/MocA family protein [Saliphagus infecundisoli]|uniref:Gfo/Idh/MocA family protein n=1 Tax=Saliphagus infecundisoli TaxID=1849069 RepID=A0ABD5QGP0_9EURY